MRPPFLMMNRVKLSVSESEGNFLIVVSPSLEPFHEEVMS